MIVDSCGRMLASIDRVLSYSRMDKSAFDVVLMDLSLPQMDGFQAAASIRENSLNRTPPIIAMATHADAGLFHLAATGRMKKHLRFEI